MRYGNIKKAVFLDRHNRFIAHVELDGAVEVCHVKNTGRCRELLVPGAEVYVQYCPSEKRSTQYDLITVRKGGRLINMDSAAPNKIFHEWLESGKCPERPTLIRPESRFGDSRLDFYAEFGEKRVYAEVKGVTLEDNGTVRFPDAPTQRGTKHLNELVNCIDAGFEAWAVFIIQMSDVTHMEPNRATDPEFADALRRASERGVRLLALSCTVTEDTVEAGSPVAIMLL